MALKKENSEYLINCLLIRYDISLAFTTLDMFAPSMISLLSNRLGFSNHEGKPGLILHNHRLLIILLLDLAPTHSCLIPSLLLLPYPKPWDY